MNATENKEIEYFDICYANLLKKHEEYGFPVTGVNDEGETLVFEGTTSDEGDILFRVTTFQKNNWAIINTYWPDGTVEETFSKVPADI